MISLAAAATTGGVKRFSIPNWSVPPNLPQALPGGPFGSSGSDEKGGCGGIRSELEGFRSSDDMATLNETQSWRTRKPEDCKTQQVAEEVCLRYLNLSDLGKD